MARRRSFEGPARRRAAVLLDGVVEQFRRAGYADVDRVGQLEARLSGSARRPLTLRMVTEGRVFGGTYGLEISTSTPVVEPSAGLSARGRGLVKLRSVSFRARGRDPVAQRIAGQLEADRRLVERLAKVHFDRIRIEPDGRAVVRHMGGSVVWVLFPPLVKPIPLVAEQVRATIAALDAFPSYTAEERTRA